MTGRLYRDCVSRGVAQSVKTDRLSEHAPVLLWNISDQDEHGDTLFWRDASVLPDGVGEERDDLLLCLGAQSTFDGVDLEGNDFCASRFPP